VAQLDDVLPACQVVPDVLAPVRVVSGVPPVPNESPPLAEKAPSPALMSPAGRVPNRIVLGVVSQPVVADVVAFVSEPLMLPLLEVELWSPNEPRPENQV
jgi:hypothetical protein